MKTIVTIIVLWLAFLNSALAQISSPIQTDRPDQTECPFITPTKYMQLEIGFPYQKTTKYSKEISVPTILTKFGINNKFELRLITEYSISREDSRQISGIQPIAIGFKSQLLEEKGIIPTMSFIGHFHLPKLASKAVQTNYYAPEFRFTMQHTLTKNQTLSYNLGAEWDGETPFPTFIYTLTTGYSFTEKISGYIELYGFIPQKDQADHRFDGGFNYLINPNHQLDLSVGMGLSNHAPAYFISLGYSFRFKI